MAYTARITSAESLGRVLQQARMVHGMSQRELARRLGTSQRYIWEIEAGKPSIFTERLFAYLRETETELSATIQAPQASQAEPTQSATHRATPQDGTDG
ncbi:helix-turn-helix domain-containing protein [Salana multivorans]